MTRDAHGCTWACVKTAGGLAFGAGVILLMASNCAPVRPADAPQGSLVAPAFAITRARLGSDHAVESGVKNMAYNFPPGLREAGLPRCYWVTAHEQRTLRRRTIQRRYAKMVKRLMRHFSKRKNWHTSHAEQVLINRCAAAVKERIEGSRRRIA